MKFPGVLGIGLGFKRINGIRTSEPAVVVMVNKKFSDEGSRAKRRKSLPRTLRVARSIDVPIDVVALGGLRREADVVGGRSLGPRRSRRLATLGTFARDPSGQSVALTAMHLFYGLKGGSTQMVSYPSEFESPAAPVLGRLLDGSMRGIDAALVAVEPPNEASWTIAGKRIPGWRILAMPGDDSASVQMVGARSGHQLGVVEYFGVSFPKWNIDSAILAHIVTQEGDSGAALLDTAGYVLGLLVGRPDASDTLRVFCAIGPILDRLGCDIPQLK